KSDEELLETIEQFGFTREEALIYFALIKHGKNGAIVKDLVQETSVGRTTIYAILDRLIKTGAVIKRGPSNTAKKAELFAASEPARFFSDIIAEKKKKLSELEEQNLLHHDFYQRLYQQGIEFTFERLDTFIQPYLKTLILEEGWTVISQIVEKGMQTFGCDVFAYELQTSEIVSDEDDHRSRAYLIIYVFDYDIETNETSRKFFIELARRKTRDNIRSRSQLTDVKLKDGNIALFGRTWPAFLVSAKVDQNYVDIGQIPILPLRNKLIFLSTGAPKFLKDLAQVVYEVEKIPLDNSIEMKN
ncbi:MAG: helix-turn-helix domain-containing protein, partial [Candidatus Thorarchaeota archaeon]